jgi:superfamily I DNA/RNA helicase
MVAAGMTYKFIFQGAVEQSADGRLAIQLDDNERQLVLSEMRAFLASVQQITRGISETDMQLVAASARDVGLASQQDVPGSLIGKLPLPFKKLGRDTHAKFDEIALDAEQFEDSGHSLSQLEKLLQNCVACHAAYRFE